MRRVREEREEGNLVFEHVKEGGFAGIIETKEENFGFFLPETEGSENAIEPVKEEHVVSCCVEGEIESRRSEEWIRIMNENWEREEKEADPR